jgi:protein-L-isoaspartate(D-aspartate) O-methyltransferase
MNFDPRKIRLIMELRQNGVADTEVLSAIERVPREFFVPEQFQDRAYENTPLPIGHGVTVSQPLIVAQMIEALECNPKMKVLEIGTGSGYQTAVLAQLFRRVYTIETIKPLLQEAEARLKHINFTNVVTKFGDGYQGWPEQAPFDRIIGSAAAPDVPQKLLDQLKMGGILVMPVGKAANDQHIVKLTRTQAGFQHKILWPVRFVPMVPAA